MKTLALPDVARTMLKGSVMALFNAGLITSREADRLIKALGLKDA